MSMNRICSFFTLLFSILPCCSFTAVMAEEIENRPFAIVALSKNGDYYAVKAKSIYLSNSRFLDAEKVDVVGNNVVTDNDSIIWSYTEKHLYSNIGKWLIQGYQFGTKSEAIPFILQTDTADSSKRWLYLSGSPSNVFRLVENKTMFRVVSNTTTSYTQAYLYDIARGYKRSGLSEGKFGTICLPYNVETAEWSGATFYEIVGKKTLDGMVISLSLRKVSALVAGCPYIFKAENETLVAAYGNEEATSASENNGLVGSLVDTPVDEGMYLIWNNMVKKCGTGCSIAANRAYINMDNVPELPNGAINDGVELQMYGIPTEICMPTISGDATSLYYNLGGVPLKDCSKGIRISRNGIKELIH